MYIICQAEYREEITSVQKDEIVIWATEACMKLYSQGSDPDWAYE